MDHSILIISNTDDDILKFRCALQTVEIHFAKNFSSGLSQIEDHQNIGIVVFDLDYAKEQWIAFITTAKAKKNLRAIRLIMLTKKAQVENENTALALGADDYLRRPLSLIHIRKVLTMHIEDLRQTKTQPTLIGRTVLFDAIFEKAPIGVILYSIDKSAKLPNHSMINPTFETFIGHSADEIRSLMWTDYTYSEDVQKELPLFEALLAGEIEQYQIEKRFIRQDATIVWAHVTVIAIELASGQRTNYVFLIKDINDKKMLEQELVEREESQRKLISNLPGMAYRAQNDEKLTMVYISEGCFQLTGFEAAELIANPKRSYHDIIAKEYHGTPFQDLKTQLATQKQFRLEYEIITKYNKRKWVLAFGKVVDVNPQGLEYVEGFVLDFSQYKALENQLQYQKRHDLTTNLPNRLALEELLEKKYEKQEAGKCALISINFTSLYLASLRFGHIYVQQIIKEVGEVLTAFISEEVHVYGVFDNRFMVYVSRYEDTPFVEELGRKIINKVNTVLRYERLSWGVGIIEVDWQNSERPSEILKHVLLASERAIDFQSKKPNLCFYNKAMSDEVDKEADLLVELTQLVAGTNREALYLQYQPIVDVKTDTIVAFEALARFESVKYGNVPPLEFIPIAEKYKLIIGLGWLIIEKAIIWYKELCTAGYGQLRFSINLSAYQLLEEQFVETILSLFKKYAVLPAKCTLEITETGINSTFSQMNSILKELQKHTFKIAIDDFGIGYSTFARESQLNVDFLKVDKLFVDALLTEKAASSVLPDIVSMAHRLGHLVIAEGVEDKRQKAYLQNIGCDMYQGYLFSRPLNPQAALTLLHANYKENYP